MQKILIVLILLVLFTQKVQAQVIEFHPAISNASTQSIVQQDAKNVQRETIKLMLEKHNSPLVGSVDTFMSVAEENNLNPYLLPSIAGVESTFGKAIYPGSYNPFGWGGGLIMFDSWDESIETVGRGLRNNYVNKGAMTLADVGAIYAGSKAWPSKVKYFIGRFETEELNAELPAETQLKFEFNDVQ